MSSYAERVLMAQSPCHECVQSMTCQKGGAECNRFRNWFRDSWRGITKEVRKEKREYFRFKMVERPNN